MKDYEQLCEIQSNLFKEIFEQIQQNENFLIFDVDFISDETRFHYKKKLFKFQRNGEFLHLYSGITCSKCKHVEWGFIGFYGVIFNIQGIIKNIEKEQERQDSLHSKDKEPET